MSQTLTRREAFLVIAAGVAGGMPEVPGLRLYDDTKIISFDCDTIADAFIWMAWFGADPDQTTRKRHDDGAVHIHHPYTVWHGWAVQTNTNEPAPAEEADTAATTLRAATAHLPAGGWAPR